MEENDAIQKRKRKGWLFLTALLFSTISQAQLTADTTLIAGPQYSRSNLYPRLWGKHYRKEWTTPVRVPVVQLSTLYGGLTPYTAAGSRQSKTLYLRDSSGKEYLLRSIDKRLGKTMPEIYHQTFVERFVNDQVSIAHPYSAITIPPLADAAKIHHAVPQIVFVPQQARLDTFNKEYGNTLYLLEQRPGGDLEEANSLDSSKKVIGTDMLLAEVLEHPTCVDQASFLRARLFDLLIGDWARHEDQWRWTEGEKEGKKLYVPIPLDRDQAYTKFDGVLLKVAKSGAGLGHLQSFDDNIKNVNEFSFPARFLDRRFLNELPLQQWVDVAKDLQQLITDEVIETSIKQLPPEVFSISGQQIIAALKSRRDKLEDFAREYYAALAKEVDITGTKKKEYFDIKRLANGETEVSIYALNEEGIKDSLALYSRVFAKEETKELRLYGIEGRDMYYISGESSDGPKLRIIAGVDQDSIIDKSSGSVKNVVYDNPGNYIERSGNTKLRLSSDTAINQYQYGVYNISKRGIKPIIFYNYEDKLFVGLGYGWKNYKWRREPIANQHDVSVRYSLPQNSFDVLYKGVVHDFIGRWSLALHAQYDFIRWNNFFGLGNETPLLTRNNDFYRTRSRNGVISIGLNRNLGKYNRIGFTGFYENVELIEDGDRFLAQKFLYNIKDHGIKHFAGASFNYTFQKLDNTVVPTKGVSFQGNISYTQNIQQTDRTVTKYGGDLDVYVPILKNLVLAMHTGAASLDGEPEFYQYNSIGGRLNLRGYRRDRFWAKTTFYNSNELQWLFDLKSSIVNGKFGLIALYDHGRVWMPGEESDIWHRGFGGGFLIAPFNKLAISVTYAKSKEIGLIHLRFGSRQ